MNFTGKYFVVTGGSSGIGRATAFLLARSGAHVFITGRDKKRLAETVRYSKNIIPIHADFSKADAADKVADTVKSSAVNISGFVHCAGEIYTEPFETFRMYELIEMENVNVNSGFKILKKLMPIFSQGSAVFVSSIDAYFGAVNPPSSGYSLTKGALISLTKALASELGGYGIRVNCIVPGLIRTRMSEDFFGDEFKELREKFLNRVPLKRAGKAEEVAKLIAFLVSDDASYISGDTIFIDGGYHIR